MDKLHRKQIVNPWAMFFLLMASFLRSMEFVVYQSGRGKKRRNHTSLKGQNKINKLKKEIEKEEKAVEKTDNKRC